LVCPGFEGWVGAPARRADFGTDPIIVAYGAGVDSTGILIGLQRAGVRPDLILFADTGSEKPETIAYLDCGSAWNFDRLRG